MAPPVQPFFGSVLLTGVAPANCESAETAPAMFCWSNAPNAPLHSDMIAILIGVPEALATGLTAGCGAGHVIVDGALATVLSGVDELLSPLPPPLSLLLSLPQPAAANAATPNATASQVLPRPRPPPPAPILCSLLLGDVTASPNGCGLSGAPLLRDVPDHRASSAT